MPTFIGLDLAWTTKNESGICWLEGDSRDNLRCTRLEAAVCDTGKPRPRSRGRRRAGRRHDRCARALHARALGRARNRPPLWALQGVGALISCRRQPGLHGRNRPRKGARGTGLHAGPRSATRRTSPRTGSGRGLPPHDPRATLRTRRAAALQAAKKGRNVAFRRNVHCSSTRNTCKRSSKREAPGVLDHPDVLSRPGLRDRAECARPRPQAPRRHARRPDLRARRMAHLDATRTLGDDRRPERLHRRAAGGLEGVVASLRGCPRA